MLEFIAIPFLAIISSIVGCLTIFRKANFLIAAASHSAFAGVALSLFFDNNFLIALLFTLVLMTISRISKDVNVGLVVSFGLSMGLAATFLSFSRDKAAFAWKIMFGDILLLTFEDLIIIVFTAVVLLALVAIYLPKFILVSFDEDASSCFGIKSKLVDVLLIVLTAFATVSTIKAVGAILVYAIFTTPAAIATILARSIRQAMILSLILSIFSLIFGLLLSFLIPIPPSALTALTVSFIYLAMNLKR
ncbi:MAG: metal ABC transporter permease [Archaeoglobaceae archaeon]|nr:metal ABC transporter permease [Archaeoglobaceae archaeon]MCX8151609.1 metal ABC transporter permease [Archaeoglobaceae archaeon]MDW8013113.1 metal ABC transporter permease [Archaeoglobaceae archaeon]